MSSVGFNNGRYFVERMFLNLCFMCPFVVYSDFGKYLRTKSAVNPGHVEKILSRLQLSMCLEKGSSMFDGSTLPRLLLICTRIRCEQIVCQEFEVPSFHYFAPVLSYI